MSIWSWGAGTCGQLGTGETVDRQLPAKVYTAVEALHQISCGGNHVAALSGTSAVVWGMAKNTGAPDEYAEHNRILAVPQKLHGSLFGKEAISAVSAGWCHTAFVTVSGKLFVAGEGAFGQLGLGSEHTNASVPIQVLGKLASCKVRQAACGMHHTVVLAHVGHETSASPHEGSTSLSLGLPAASSCVFAFGANRRGQAGAVHCQTQSFTSADASQEPSTSEDTRTSALTMPGSKNAAVFDQQGGPSKVWEPCLVAALQNGACPDKVLAGGHHSGVIDTSGCLHLWGRSYISQEDAHFPVPLQLPASDTGYACHTGQQNSSVAAGDVCDNSHHKWDQVSLGWSHALGLDSQGHVWAWGSNTYGQCGQPHSQPAEVTSMKTAPNMQFSEPTVSRAQTVSQRNMHLIDLDAPRTAATRVVSSHNTNLVRQPQKVAAADMEHAVCVSAGSEHSMAVTSDGKVFAWGWGEHGQLGIDSTGNLDQPKSVHLPACSSVICGSGFTIAVEAKH